MESCEHKSISEEDEMFLFEEYGLSLEEIKKRAYFACDKCGELFFESNGKMIPYFSSEDAKKNGWQSDGNKPLPKGDDCEETGPNLEEIRSREWFW